MARLVRETGARSEETPFYLNHQRPMTSPPPGGCGGRTAACGSCIHRSFRYSPLRRVGSTRPLNRDHPR
ncbi:hypothetical protein RND71_033347 [Anisodus tanguticus]|uniref:Uncharacterized protein n=1 Tax=Anisodus tanguticus TaxID=243964 RepID=A0AAE1R8K9_9SOLA|nr:hypothetical protein RND71_033347 [Anisodus tanguticus]